jgi:hypothetical protein
MTNIVLWTYALQIRSKNSSGTILHTWAATNEGSSEKINQPIKCGPPTYEPVLVGEREALDFSKDNVYAGFRKHLTVVFEQRSDYIRGPSGTSPIVADLDSVLSDIITVGNYLELTLDGSTWRKVNLVGSVNYSVPSGKNVSLGLQLEFETALVFSSMGGVAAADW